MSTLRFSKKKGVGYVKKECVKRYVFNLDSRLSKRQHHQCRSIRKIHGYLKVEAAAEGFDSLSFLENLEVILGQSRVQNAHSLWIHGTSLKFLGLSKLAKIGMGTVLIYDNKNLCYADQMDWTRVCL